MRKYWRGIAIAGVVAVISGCGAASGSKNSINNGYIMETRSEEHTSELQSPR